MRLLAKPSFLHLVSLFFVILLVQGCGDDGGFVGPNYENVPPPFETEGVRDSTTQDGLTIYFIEEGSGQSQVISRDEVSIRYTGRTKDGEIFDSTYRNGRTTGRLTNLTPVPKTNPATGRPTSPLIDGFRRGIIGMKVGEKRKLIIPPSLGYGDTDGHNLENDTLIFDIELVGIL